MLQRHKKYIHASVPVNNLISSNTLHFACTARWLSFCVIPLPATFLIGIVIDSTQTQISEHTRNKFKRNVLKKLIYQY